MSDAYYEELKTYINFTDEDAQRIMALLPIVEDHFPDIVNTFYTDLWAMPKTRRLFKDEEQVERLRGTLGRWLRELFVGTYGHEYFKRRAIIGRRHVEVGLLPHFVVGAMNGVREHMHRVVEAANGQLVPNKTCSLRALDKLLDMELSIMLQSYHDKMTHMKLEVPLALASGLAHEVRNPLNALALNVTLMERRLSKQSDLDMSDVLDVMRSEIGRIKTLTGDIMDFAKPINITPVWCPADDLVHSITTIFAPTFHAHNIDFSTIVQEGTKLWVDIDRLKQILINLINNAIESFDGQPGQLELKVENTQTETTIKVTDNGRGISPEVQYRAFDLFYTTKITGTGMGLPIAKKIMDAHGGQILLFSSKEGTRIQLHFPRPKDQ